MKYIPRVLHYLRPYWYLAVVSVALIAIGAAAGLLAPWPLQVLIDNVLQNQPLPAFLARFVGPLAENRFGLWLRAVVSGVAVTPLLHGADRARQLCQHQDRPAHGARLPERPVPAYPAPVAGLSRPAPLGNVDLRHQLTGGRGGTRGNDDSGFGPKRADTGGHALDPVW